MIKTLLIILITLIYNFGIAQVSASCNNNVFCDPANLPNDIYVNNSRSTIKMIVPDGDCSCTLIRQAFTNGDDNQQENIIITARHCIRDGFSFNSPLLNLNNIKFVFNFSNPDCSPIANAGGFDSKEARYFLSGGATLIDESFIHDIAVLRINSPIPPHFKPFYSGWTANPVGVTALFFNIHHPQGDIKKISSANGLLTGGSLPFPTRYNINWNHGTTEFGSSGSGLWNFNRRIVGVLSGNLGGANCNGIPNANFGKFRNFWLGNSVTRNKLNPNNQFGLVGTPGGEIECHAGDLFLDGTYWPAEDYQPNNQIKLKCVGNMFLAHGTKTLTVKSNAEFIFEAGGQVVTLLPGFTAEAGSDVTINSNVACSASKNALPQFDIDSSSVNDYLTDDQVKALESTYINMNLSSNYFNGEDLLEINPNPSSDKFYLKTNLKVDNIYVTDALGKLVNCFIKDNIIDLSQLVGGVYFANLKVNQQIIHKKIVLNK